MKIAAGLLLTILVVAVTGYYLVRPPKGEVENLVYHLERRGSMFDRIYATAWSLFPPFVRIHLRPPIPAESDRRTSAFYLGRMGSAAGEAIPVLSQVALKDNDLLVRIEAAGALVGIAPQSPETSVVLVRQLQEPDASVCQNAARLLAVIGKECRTAVKPLIAWLEGPPFGTNTIFVGVLSQPKAEEIIQCLRVVGPENPLTISALAKFLADDKRLFSSFDASRSALQTLGKAGPAARPALPVLKSLLGRDAQTIKLNHSEGVSAPKKLSPWVLRDCGEAICKIDPHEAPFVLSHLANHTDQVDLNELFGRMGPFAKELIPEFKKEFATVSEARRPSLADVFWRMAPEENEFILAQLREGLKGTNLLARANTAFVLWEITGDNLESVKAIVECQDQSTGQDRMDIIRLLGRMGRAAEATLPALRKIAASDPDQFVRTAAEAAISKIEADLRKTK